METIELSQDEADAKVIREGLNEYNFRRVPEDRHETLTLVAQRDGRMIGGLVGGTYWGWLYVELLWVDEAERGRGLGGQLLARAEEIARERGCRNAHLETHDFQSLDFYLRRGYEVFGQLDDLPEGHVKYFLRKRLGE